MFYNAPFLDISVSHLPMFHQYSDKYHVKTVDNETVHIDSALLPENTSFGVHITGDSMEPNFHDGQIAWVAQQESVEDGEIGIFSLNGDAYIKKLQNNKDGLFLISPNTNYAPIPVRENDRLDIFGKVVGTCDENDLQ